MEEAVVDSEAWVGMAEAGLLFDHFFDRGPVHVDICRSRSRTVHQTGGFGCPTSDRQLADCPGLWATLVSTAFFARPGPSSASRPVPQDVPQIWRY